MKKQIINILKGNKYLIIGIILLIPILGFSIYLGLSPTVSLNKMQSASLQDKQLMERFDTSFYSKELTPLIHEKSFSEAFIRASDNDSIILYLDLQDSIAGLAINGVKLHESHIFFMKTDKLLSRVNNLHYSHLFSKPLRINKDYSTIVREPIIEKKAPRDTIEALSNILQPDTLIMGPVFIEMELDKNIKVVLSQSENITRQDKWKNLAFRSRMFLNNFFRYSANFLSFKQSEYISTIEVKIEAAELGEIYRALPEKGLIVIRLPLSN